MAEVQDETTAPETQELPSEISIEYSKSPGYRTLKVDGVHGGITPQGDLSLYLYDENVSLPSVTKHEINDAGELGEPTHQYSSDSRVVREVAVGLSVDAGTALTIVEWLAEKVAEAAHLGLIDEEKLEEVGIEFEVSESDGE